MIIKKHLNWLTVLFVILALSFRAVYADGHGHGEHGHHDEPISLEFDDGTLAQIGVRVERVESRQIDGGIELFGEIRPDGDRLAHIVPRFAGVVKEVRKTAGETVRAGDVLAIIESNESLTSYELRTLLDGTIIAKHITRGEAVDRDKGAFTIADLSTVWAELAVYPKDLDNIQLGQKVLIADSDRHHSQEGVISYITPTVDVPTRTTRARVVLDNQHRKWRPGLFVTARLFSPHIAVATVSKTALQQIAGHTIVFVQEQRRFEPRQVVVGRVGEQFAEITHGLSTGEAYAVGNTFILKAELGKGSAAHEH